ncbi:MAG: SpoIID/LytB domain-containing protein, partial [Planctomycetota bacterium]
MSLRILPLVLIMLMVFSHSGESAVVRSVLKRPSVGTKEPLIKVLLSEGRFEGEISCATGSLTLAWRDGRTTVPSPVSFSSRGDGLQIGERVFDESVAIRATAGAMEIGARIHEGWVVWIPGTPYEGGWKMIEQLPLERYLLGVVSKEMSASTFPAAALEAQAVAARTYTYFHYLTGGASRD